MPLVDILKQIEEINRADTEAALEFGPFEMGPRDILITELLCVDGKASVAASTQIQEFYRYALWWRLCSVELEWCNPLKIGEIIEKPAIREMIEGDLNRGNISIDGMRNNNSVLFSVDNYDSPFDRAYFVFDSDSEPHIVYARSEVSIFTNLREYLDSWLITLK